MKKKYTFRFKESDVKNWKKQAQSQNRSLTNFIQTTLNKNTEEIKKQAKKSRASN